MAAHPEGHPIIDDDALYQCLRDKQDLATYLVTQMCFDPQVLVAWLEGMRARDIDLPAWIGLPGVMSRMKLFRTSLRIGVGESVGFARKQGGMAEKLLGSSIYTPDELLRGLTPAIREQRLGIDGFYLFSFNQVQDTISWRDGLLASMHEPDAAVC